MASSSFIKGLEYSVSACASPLHVSSLIVPLLCNHEAHSSSADVDSDGPHVQLPFSPSRLFEPLNTATLQDVELKSISPLFAEMSFDELLSVVRA
jgi:hypothetical protein